MKQFHFNTLYDAWPLVTYLRKTYGGSVCPVEYSGKDYLFKTSKWSMMTFLDGIYPHHVVEVDVTEQELLMILLQVNITPFRKSGEVNAT
jgi:hypothetical protein